MSNSSKIEWTDATWNPVRGCTQISPGCKNCYAKTFAERFRNVPGHPFEQGFDLRLVLEKLAEPLSWARPRMIFVNSMSDLFHEDVPDSFIQAVAEVMLSADWHIYQVLTKRPERLQELLRGPLKAAAKAQHIWWGVSVEDRKHGLPRIPQLKRSQAAVTFLSVEPLLESLGRFSLKGIAWVIVGGESGPNARGLEKEWVIEVRDLCRSAGVPFFFKQWGGFQKSRHGRHLEGRTHDDFPEVRRGEDPGLEERRSRLKQLRLQPAT